MDFRPGTRFGRYEIVCPLGAGGMGEVYRARDSHLGRDLAIKVLSRKASPEKQGLERFEREARSASALNHPNIVTIFELGQVDSVYYIAMELVEGELLRSILTAGPLSLNRAIPIAAQIAEGLAKAHEAGVVHRDLKPENVMISCDGFVKILDFGLAKLAGPGFDGNRETTTLRGTPTTAGTILGTVEYMSPEQARGVPVDFRSDQFSLGSVLYEMVTGRSCFRRRSAMETIAAILRDDPEPVASLNSQVPAPLCWAIERCLAKDPNGRYASTRDLARDLATIRERLSDAPLRHSPPCPNNLPAQRTNLVGRAQEVAALKELLLRNGIQLVTLTGPGGIGKTRLALKAAAEAAEHFPNGVCFVSLAGVTDPALISSVVAQALGVKESGGEAAVARVKEYLQDVRTSLLIILDNFEHLLAAAPIVAEFLTVAPKLKIVATSRAPLHIYGEHEFPVPPLALPDFRSTSSLEELSENPAVALFLDRVEAVKASFELTQENAGAVAAICARLDGLPLAIELAAARIKLLSPSAMETRLESRLQLLTGGAKDLPERQQTLRATVDWSYGLLSAPEQALLRRLAVFAGGCTLEGVEAVCNTKQDLGIDVFEGMASLVDKSLVQQIEAPKGEPRFVSLEIIREFGLECLIASGEEAATKRAHAAYCLVLAEECTSPAGPETISLFELEHDNFRAALEWLTRSGNAEWGLRLGAALFQFWETGEYLTEGRDRLEKLLKLEGAQSRTNLRARVLLSASVLAGEQGDYESASALVEESLSITRELNDARGVGVALNALAVHNRNRGDLVAARSLLEESLVVWRDLGDRIVVARSLNNLASVAKQQKDLALARSLFQECLSIFRELGDRAGTGWALNNTGDVARAQGDLEAARALYEESLAIFRQLDDKWGMAGCLADLGSLACDRKDYQVSRSFYTESMKLFQELGQKRGIAHLLDTVACSAAAQSNPERSLRLAGAAAALRRVLGMQLPSTEQERLDEILHKARHELPDNIAAAAWMEGWATPVEKAIQYALSSG
jgi:predicted ATPase